MNRKTAPAWLASLLIGAIFVVASGGLGALHRHVDHPPHQKHACHHGHHHHHGDSHGHDEKPTPDQDHEDCETCLVLMVGGQWAISLEEPRLLTTALRSQEQSVESIVRGVELSRAALPRGPPAVSL